MIIKSIAIIAFLLIVLSLATALFHLVKHENQEQSKKTAKALTYRISLSVLLFLFIFLALSKGAFIPQGIGSKVQHTISPSQ